MRFNEVIGQKEAQNRLLQMVGEQRIPHAILLCGPSGCGKMALALTFASYLLGENDSEPTPQKRNGANMTKSELIERLCMRYPQLRSQDVEETVKLIIEKICQSLEKGDRVEIRGFGSFSLHYREARTGRNPKTGESVEVPAKSIPYFRAGKELRERVDENDA